jgi:hypothetical protein
MNFRHPLMIMAYVLAAVLFVTFITTRAGRFTAASPTKCIQESVAHAKAVQRGTSTRNPSLQFAQYVGALSRLDAARAAADDATIHRLTQTDAPLLRRQLLAQTMALVDNGKLELTRDEVHAVVQM